MALFLIILEGSTPDEAQPLIATGDQELIKLVRQGLMYRLEGGVSTISKTQNREGGESR